MNLTLLATPLVVLALVNLAKSLGVTGRWSTLLAVLLGITFAVSDYVFLGDSTRTTAGIYTAGAAGLILGLTAAGLYDVANKVGGTASVTRTVERGSCGGPQPQSSRVRDLTDDEEKSGTRPRQT